MVRRRGRVGIKSAGRLRRAIVASSADPFFDGAHVAEVFPIRTGEHHEKEAFGTAVGAVARGRLSRLALPRLQAQR